MEYQAVLPDHDGVHEDAHAEDVVCLVPGQAGGEEEALDQHRDVHEVTEVQHEEMLVECDVVPISGVDGIVNNIISPGNKERETC